MTQAVPRLALAEIAAGHLRAARASLTESWRWNKSPGRGAARALRNATDGPGLEAAPSAGASLAGLGLGVRDALLRAQVFGDGNRAVLGRRAGFWALGGRIAEAREDLRPLAATYQYGSGEPTGAG